MAGLTPTFSNRVTPGSRASWTTWEELEEDGCLWDYRLTSRGWLKALEVAGTLGSPEMKEQLGKVCDSS